jgi:hypothetical protein
VGSQGPKDSEVGDFEFVGQRDGPVMMGIVWQEISGAGGCGSVQQRGRVVLVAAVGVECGCGEGEELVDINNDSGAVEPYLAALTAQRLCTARRAEYPTDRGRHADFKLR